MPRDLDGPSIPWCLRIASARPNSVSPDGLTEDVTIRNAVNVSVDLHGRIMRVSVGAAWRLDSLGMIAAAVSKTLRRDCQPMSLSNSGDTITLVNQMELTLMR